jgi:acid phosphatase class B
MNCIAHQSIVSTKILLTIKFNISRYIETSLTIVWPDNDNTKAATANYRIRADRMVEACESKWFPIPRTNSDCSYRILMRPYPEVGGQGEIWSFIATKI